MRKHVIIHIFIKYPFIFFSSLTKALLIDSHYRTSFFFHKRHDLHLYKIHTRFVLTQERREERERERETDKKKDDNNYT